MTHGFILALNKRTKCAATCNAEVSERLKPCKEQPPASEGLLKHMASDHAHSDRRLPIGDLIHANGDSRRQRDEPPDLYRFAEHGREYYAYKREVVCPFPCDEVSLASGSRGTYLHSQEEKNRLDMFHYLIHDIALNGRLHNADLDLRPRGHRPQVLDVGFGTGIWCLDMANAFPSADVTGIDLINNQPPEANNPRNVSFITNADFTSLDWGFRRNSFEFVRMSQLCGCVPDWLALYRTVFG